ncbi:hypothetical protein D1013_04545 [Euzebyella marina]|uniref:Uncharacterized protein n=2 Tax=Euzebyella marina TaxID=1761453 RepID=A0A3G2L3C6_9FLAO|nr:hypothetical protein D1013_04545 [Euzebyella marina]
MSWSQFDRVNSFSNNKWAGGQQLEKPQFFILPWQPGTQLVEKETNLSIKVDSLGLKPVKALQDSSGTIIIYVSDISTPVCADGDCRLMDIRFYWTLLGGYAGFDSYQQSPLTKHDHDEFVYADYLKLHQLLLDDNSILKRRKVDELVKKPQVSENENVDAVAGATIKEVKESVVSGALYSCYTAWHIVHGVVKNQIRELTVKGLSEDQLVSMLSVDNPDYQIFVLKRFSKAQYEKNYKQIAAIFKDGIPLVRSYIVKNVPSSFWENETLQTPFWNCFSDLDINSRSLLLEKIAMAPLTIIYELSKNLGVMTKNQLKQYLNHLSNTKGIDKVLIESLKSFADDPNETYNYLVDNFLEDYVE